MEVPCRSLDPAAPKWVRGTSRRPRRRRVRLCRGWILSARVPKAKCWGPVVGRRGKAFSVPGDPGAEVHRAEQSQGMLCHVSVVHAVSFGRLVFRVFYHSHLRRLSKPLASGLAFLISAFLGQAPLPRVLRHAWASISLRRRPGRCLLRSSSELYR